MVFRNGNTPWNKGKKGIRTAWNKGIKMWENREHPFQGRNHSEEAKKKISEANKGREPWNRGAAHSEEAIEKIKAARAKQVITKEQTLLARLSPNFGMKGKVHSEETRKKISASIKERFASKKNHPFYGKHHTKETRRKLSIARKGKYTGERCPSWKGGISFIPYCPKFNDALKESIRNRDNRTCQLCGTKENGKKLSVHHIHYDKPNCDPDLITLCNNCNTKVNGKRDYWEQYFMNLLKERGLIKCQSSTVTS